MSVLSGLHRLESGLAAPELLRLLITQRHPGRVAVTASLKARSIAVLKMVADIAPATPVIFCHASALFPESRQYRQDIVERLGLVDVSEQGGRATLGLDRVPQEGDLYECLWADAVIGDAYADGGKVRELVHLNQALAGKECWVSAVYHLPRATRNRLDLVGGIVRADPLLDWSDGQVLDFLAENDIPLHPRARRTGKPVTGPLQVAPHYCY